MLVASLIWIMIEIIKEYNQPIYQPKPIIQNPKIDDVVDYYGYNYDVEHYGEEFAESMRKIGRYAIKRRNIYG